MGKKKKTIYVKTFDDEVTLSNPNLQKIIKFFLLECPVPGTSERGGEFSSFGIAGSAAFTKLKAAMLSSATSSLKQNYKPCTKSELPQQFKIMEDVFPPDEYCVFLKYDEGKVMPSLFAAIRNAFAHGSFRVKSYNKCRIYYLRNFDGYLKAEMVLHEETLIKWIACVKNFNS